MWLTDSAVSAYTGATQHAICNRPNSCSHLQGVLSSHEGCARRRRPDSALRNQAAQQLWGVAKCGHAAEVALQWRYRRGVIQDNQACGGGRIRMVAGTVLQCYIPGCATGRYGSHTQTAVACSLYMNTVRHVVALCMTAAAHATLNAWHRQLIVCRAKR